MCRVLVRVVNEVAEDLYNLHLITFIVSIGSIKDSLRLLEMLDEEDAP